ncbi:hypothetical protein [Asticcacaulis sp. W401b]|uniref:hypothetical protein n=1 Tax=Asticcacaulis sp. W401b TaxID=3388666 RepID=UPI00397096CB
MAVVDCILMPEWEYRYFSFNSLWNSEENEKMASMRTGQGHEYFISFSSKGAIGKVYSGIDAMPFAIEWDKVPRVFEGFKLEPAFKTEETSFLFWREALAEQWSVNPSLESYNLLSFLVGGADFYQKWAENYYGLSINIDHIRDVFSGNLNKEIIYSLNSEVDISIVENDLREIYGREFFLHDK